LSGDPSDWTDERNRLLATALTLLEDETCSCGTPAWIGHSTDRNITFEIDSTTCFGCAELEKDAENDRRGARKKPKGEFRFVVPQNVWPEQPLPSRSELYSAEESKR
jgi:hypothetical protein